MRAFDVYQAKVVWDGRVRPVFVDEFDATPLVGMALLRGYEYKMQVRARGKVTVNGCPGDRRQGEQRGRRKGDADQIHPPSSLAPLLGRGLADDPRLLSWPRVPLLEKKRRVSETVAP